MKVRKAIRRKTSSPLSVLLKGYGYNSVSLSKVLMVSPPTAMAKINEPSRLTVGDIALLVADGIIPKEEIVLSLSKEF